MTDFARITLSNMTVATQIVTTDYVGTWYPAARYTSAAIITRTVINSTLAVRCMLDHGIAGNATTTFFSSALTTLNADLLTTLSSSVALVDGPIGEFVRIRIEALTTTLNTQLRVEMLGRY